MSENKSKSTKQNRKEDGKFHSKNIKHDPQDESARSKFNLQNPTSDRDRTAAEKASQRHL